MIRMALHPLVSPAHAFRRVLDPIEADLLVREYLDVSGSAVREVTPYFARPDGAEGGVAGYRVAMMDGSTEYVTVLVGRKERVWSGLERYGSEAARSRGALAAAAIAPDRLALLTTFPLDRRIPGLHSTTDVHRVYQLMRCTRRSGRSEAAALHGHWGVASYYPERRAVIQWDLRVAKDGSEPVGPRSVYLRAHAEPSPADRAWSALVALRAAGFPAPVPELRPDRTTFLERAVDGVTPPLDDLSFEEFGRTVARLHETAVPDGLPWIRPRWRLAHAGRALRRLRNVSDPLWRRARRVWEHLDARPPAFPEVPRFLHGDLHPGHVVVGERLSLVDFDRARVGSPSGDVATLEAHLCLRAPDLAGHLMERFRSGYEALADWPEDDFGWHRATALLGLVDVPFRQVDPQWEAVTRGLVRRAEALA